jgi:predicted AlkP superfamily phosphohydrolase/phosphomutase/tetratricopeptide (TPR) repeat protein
MGKKLTNKILLIGWDAAEWSIIEPLIHQGKMPALKSLMDRGVYGRLKTMDPPLSPMLWTSIATGVRADKHGICGFVEPSPDGEGLRPVTSTSRKVKAIWNIYTQNNLKSNIVAWWPTNPVEQINGVMISNLYQVANKPKNEDWQMPEGTVHPKEMEEEMKEWRIHPSEITAAMIAPFIPNIVDDLELRKDKHVASVVKILANAASVHAASTHLMEKTSWDLMAVYHDAIDHFCHVAMKFHPPKRKHIDEKDFENFKEIVEAGYRFHDMMLDRTLEMIDDDTTVILMSDHGFYSDHRRPIVIPKEPSGPAAEHSPFGVLVIAGPGIKNTGEEFTGASVIDITPTILAMSGLAVGQDMEGKVLHQCFNEPIEPDFIPSWELVDGDCGMHDKDLVEDPWAAQEALQQLVELGYIEAMDDDKLKLVERSKAESEYYKARNMIDGGRIDQAIPILEDIFKETKIIRYGQRLAFAYLNKREYFKVSETIEQLREQEKVENEELKTKKKEKNPEDPFLNNEFEEPLYLDYIEGLMLLALNKPKKALPLLEKVQKKNQNNLDVPMNIAKVHLLRKNYAAAEKQYIKALAIDEKSVQAHHGLGLCMLRQNKIDDAIEEFLLAIESNFYKPNVHYHLGEALYRNGDFEEASEAFELALRLSPGMTKARKWLKNIYSEHLNSPEKAKLHEEFLNNNIKGEIIIVTGLHGSGGEYLLEHLEQAGIHILVDEKSVSKEEKKSFELQKIVELSQNSEWLKDAGGKAILVNGQMLSFLPNDFAYKVIVMNRDLKEVIQQQQEFIGKKLAPDTLPLKHFGIVQKLQEQINTWLNAHPHIPVHFVDFEELCSNSSEQLSLLEEFIGIELKK